MNAIETKSRIKKYDIARTCAILCVVLCHVIEEFYTILCTVCSYNTYQENLIFISYTIGRIGVPIFLFLTGALVLKREIENNNGIFLFYKRNFMPLFITNAIWVIIYNIILYRFSIGIKDLLLEIFCVKYIPVYQNTWYMPMILRVYLFLPIIAKIIKNISPGYFKPLIFFMLIPPFFNYCYFLVYIICGYYIASSKKNIKNNIIYTIIVLSFVITKLIQWIKYDEYQVVLIWYSNYTLLLCSICIFILFNKIRDEKVNGKIVMITNYISKISLAIYYIHILIVKHLSEPIKALLLPLAIKMPLLYIYSILLSILIIFILSKNKYLKKWLLYYKN